MTPEQKQKLNEEIAETLELWQSESASSSDGFNIIRWARKGWLKGDVK